MRLPTSLAPALLLHTALIAPPRRAPPALMDGEFVRRETDSFRLPPSEFWEQPPLHKLPEELMGPWELKCSVSGVGAMWVELDENGRCSCSAKVGKGRRWSATQVDGYWRLRFVLLDKLSRPLRGRVSSSPTTRAAPSSAAKCAAHRSAAPRRKTRW